MIFRYVLFIYLIQIIVAELKIPAVYEEIDEGPQTEGGPRVPRHPSKQNKYDYRSFSFQNAQQQDQQKLRYARQQQVDSYMRAYHQQVKEAIESSKRVPKARKIEKALFVPSEQVVKTTQRPKPETVSKVRKTVEKEKNPPSFGYKVFEDVDQEVQPSQKRISRVYLAQDDLLKAIHYPIPEGFVSNGHSLPPKVSLPVAKVPQSYGLGAYGTVQKSQLDALNSLLNKPPTTQLEGLNQLLTQKHVYAYTYPEVSTPTFIPEKKEYTPIEEHVVDVANTQSKPNVVVQPIQINTKPQKYLELAKVQATQENKAVENVSTIQKYNVTNKRKKRESLMEQVVGVPLLKNLNLKLNKSYLESTYSNFGNTIKNPESSNVDKVVQRVAQKVVHKREAQFPGKVSSRNKTEALFEMVAPNLEKYEATTLKIENPEDTTEVEDEDYLEEVPTERSNYEEFDYEYTELKCDENFEEMCTTLLPETTPGVIGKRAFNLDKKIHKMEVALGLVPQKKIPPKRFNRRKYRRYPRRRRPKFRKPPPPIHHPKEVMNYRETPPLEDYTDYYAEFSSESEKFAQGYTYKAPDSTIYINMHKDDPHGYSVHDHDLHDLHVPHNLHDSHVPLDPDGEEGKNIIVINNSNDNHNHGGNAAIKGGHGGHGKHRVKYKGHRGHRGHRGHHRHRKMSKARLLTLNQKLDHVIEKLRRKDILEQ